MNNNGGIGICPYTKNDEESSSEVKPSGTSLQVSLSCLIYPNYST